MKNRRRDQALKERASLKKKQKVVASGSDDESEEESGVGGSRSRDDLEARMARAMMEASQEFDEDEDGRMRKEPVKKIRIDEEAEEDRSVSGERETQENNQSEE